VLLLDPVILKKSTIVKREHGSKNEELIFLIKMAANWLISI
jgi:hypothetical protein